MGHALVLDTGAGTHITVVYFNRRERIDSKIIEIAKTFCHDLNLQVVDLQVGEMWGANSILVNGELAKIKKDMIEHFKLLGYDIDVGRQGMTAHINIRGDKKLLERMNKTVDLVGGWSGM